MSRWTPCKRRDFIQRLRTLGFDDPIPVQVDPDDHRQRMAEFEAEESPVFRAG